MTKKQLVILSVLPISLLAFGLLGMQLSAGQLRTLPGQEIGALLTKAFDDPSKVTPGHVDTVTRAAIQIELADEARQRSAARLFGTFAQGCLGLGVLGLVTIWAANSYGRGRD